MGFVDGELGWTELDGLWIEEAAGCEGLEGSAGAAGRRAEVGVVVGGGREEEGIAGRARIDVVGSSRPETAPNQPPALGRRGSCRVHLGWERCARHPLRPTSRCSRTWRSP